jgi:ribosomal protein S4
MILIIKNKCSYYRRFETDIWGLSYCDLNATEHDFKKSWFIRFFLKIYRAKILLKWKRMRRYIYRIDIINIKKRKRKYKNRWLSLRLTRLYFLTLKDNQFRKIFYKAKKLDGNMESNYLYLLECRVFPILYRLNFLPDIFLSLRFVKTKKLYINYNRINNVNAYISVGALITPRKFWKLWIKYIFKKRLRLKAVLFNTARFIFISFKFFYAFLIKKPKKKDLVYPINLDIQRITGYY